jgi:hypothetical protein
MKRVLLFVLLSGLAFGQAVSTTSRRIQKGSTKPATCSIGDVWEDTSTSPAVMYHCNVANTWAAFSNGSVTVTGMTNPLTTTGDIVYSSSGTTPARLGANATATNKFLRSVSSGVPSWAQPACADLSNASASCATDATNATNLASGTVPDARFPATLPAASGVNLTALNATNIASGTLAMARLTLMGSSAGTKLVTSSLSGDPTTNNCVKWIAGGILGDAGAACGSGGGGGGITNSAGNNVVMKSDATNAIASTITDDGTTVTSTATGGIKGQKLISGTAATGMTTGDASVSRAATTGAVYLGSDGTQYLFGNAGAFNIGAMNVSVDAGKSIGSADTGAPKFTFGTNSITANQPVAAPSVTTAPGDGSAGFVGLTQGTAQAVVANMIGHTAPVSVTGYNFSEPGAAGDGVLLWSNVSNIVTGVFTGTSGTGNFARVTSPTFVTPALGTPSALVLTNATGLPAAAMPALTGDVTSSAGAVATTIRAALGTRTACATDIAPVTGDDGLMVLLNPATAIHITRFSGGVTGTTSVVANLVKGSASLIADSTLTAGDANQVVVTTFANGSAQCGGTSSCAVAAHAPVTVHIGTITGTPTSVSVCVDYTVD